MAATATIAFIAATRRGATLATIATTLVVVVALFHVLLPVFVSWSQLLLIIGLMLLVCVALTEVRLPETVSESDIADAGLPYAVDGLITIVDE